MGPAYELPEGITNDGPNVDLLIAPDSRQGMAKVLAGTNGFSGKPDYLIGFVLPDEQAASQAVKQISRYYVTRSNGLTKGHDSFPLFSLRRRLGDDASGKPVFEQIYGGLVLDAKSRARSVTSKTPNEEPTSEKEQQAKQDIARLKLQHAEQEVKAAEKKTAVGLMSKHEIQKLKFSRDIAAAELKGDRVEAARLKLAMTESDLEWVGKRIAIGMATPQEYNQAKLARDVAEVEFKKR